MCSLELQFYKANYFKFMFLTAICTETKNVQITNYQFKMCLLLLLCVVSIKYGY